MADQSVDVHLHFDTKKLLKQLIQCENALHARKRARGYKVTREEFVREMNRVSPPKGYIPEKFVQQKRQRITQERHGQ